MSISSFLQMIKCSSTVEQVKNATAVGRKKLKGFSQTSKEKYLRLRDVFRLQTADFSQEVNRVINQLTGYEECERLRLAVIRADDSFQKLRDDLRSSRGAFDAAIENRYQCQKDLNTLLQRKQSWSDEDLMRFTELYRKEMRLEQSEVEARTTNQNLEKAADDAHQKLLDTVRERYQEEQLWSDKIRRLSTFGTFSLMGLNVLLFLMIQLIIEPRKRRNLLGNFDTIIDGKISRHREDIQNFIIAEISPLRLSRLSATNDAMPSLLTDKKVIQAVVLGAGTFILLSFARFIFYQ